MPRFVVLRHEMPSDLPGATAGLPSSVDAARPSHWDFMLESGAVLRTWSLTDEPREGCTIAAEALPDHRLAYLTYEGPVTGGRGTVARWDDGSYVTLDDTSAKLMVSLTGRRLVGLLTLERDNPLNAATSTREPAENSGDLPPVQRWRFHLSTERVTSA